MRPPGMTDEVFVDLQAKPSLAALQIHTSVRPTLQGDTHHGRS